jgi:hypothetical protein
VSSENTERKRLCIFFIPERHNRRVADFIVSTAIINPEIHTLMFVCSSFNLLSVTQDYMKENDWMRAKNELTLL